MTEAEVTRDESFGIVPIFARKNTFLFLLIQHHAGHWGFPKGHADPGETPLQAARREFFEETGIADYRLVEEVSFLERYQFMRQGQKYEKTVVYFPAFVTTPTVQYQREEIRAYSWATFDSARSLLTFQGSRRILLDAQHYLVNYVAKRMISN